MLLRSQTLSSTQRREIESFRDAVVVAALLHDIGHLAPGSHIAFKTWFPECQDSHEEVAVRILKEDNHLHQLLEEHQSGLTETVCRILNADDSLPPWTWEVLSSGGWNCDRGHWCIADSLLAGVNYGDYNINAIIESLTITEDSRLALRENRLDAMMHFSVSRHAMYRQIFQHRVLLSADMLNSSLVKRARFLKSDLEWCDEVMKHVLSASDPSHLTLQDINEMREAWWRYHLLQWRRGEDVILADLADRLVNRRLFKTIRLPEERKDELIARAQEHCSALGFNPDYYLHTVSTFDTHTEDELHAVEVVTEKGELCPLAELDPLFKALAQTPRYQWIAVPTEVKTALLQS